ncbi:HAMP domain-containing sensor histidine kinase [uncultured Tateyamaria sp.]|uniref:sensor histidine kinase n=1 Tax=uncultured Tateyamaria sp. TaxID=455651 RepID=UPI00260ADC60|nr:HAMP domain-containing sensor histidine kinase [uncultured Tateyamaria sp.]
MSNIKKQGDLVLAASTSRPAFETPTFAELHAAIVNAPYASLLIDDAGRVVLINRRAKRQFAPTVDFEEYDGRDKYFSELTHQSVDEVRARLSAAASTARARFTMRTGRERKTPKTLDFHVALLPTPGRTRPLYHLTQDHLTSTVDALIAMNGRRLETQGKLTELEARHAALQQVMIATEAYAHTASHDLRTPLNTLSGLLQMFDVKFGADLPERAAEYLSYMSRAVEQMDKLTHDFLDHARSASVELEREPVDLVAQARTAVADLEADFEATGTSWEITGTANPVMAEPTLVRMLLSNLLTNSLKYRHPDRSGHIDITLTEGDEGLVEMVVRDNGCGFDPGASEAIFLPFRRCNTDVEGTGIGLATCREVCRRHGWTITAQSDGETGATFTILAT